MRRLAIRRSSTGSVQRDENGWKKKSRAGCVSWKPLGWCSRPRRVRRMQGFRAVYLRLRNLRRRRLDRELDEEIRFHLQMSARDRIESGATADQARMEAEQGFGNVTALKERSRDMF